MTKPVSDYERGYVAGLTVGRGDQRQALDHRARMINELLAAEYDRGYLEGVGDRPRSAGAIAIDSTEYLASAIPAATGCARCGNLPAPDSRVRLLLTVPAGHYRGWVHANPAICEAVTAASKEIHAK